jgi:hypothetical protein
MFPGEWIGESHGVCYSFILSIDTQAGLEPVVVVVLTFLSVVWCGEAFHRLGVQDVKSLILVDALSLFDGGRRREGK